MSGKTEAICDLIKDRRICGYITCTVSERDTAKIVDTKGIHATLDDFVRELGFTSLGDGWIEVCLEDAKTLVRAVILNGLANRQGMQKLLLWPSLSSRYSKARFGALRMAIRSCQTRTRAKLLGRGLPLPLRLSTPE